MPAGASGATTLVDVSLSPPVDGRLGVAKTYKLYVGGAFPRSESGRSYPVTDAKGKLLAHAALASRKDLRDAVSAARAALPGWSGATAYNRGQVLYRVAEMLQARRDGFVDDVVAAEGIGRKRAGAVVDAAVGQRALGLLGPAAFRVEFGLKGGDALGLARLNGHGFPSAGDDRGAAPRAAQAQYASLCK